MAPARYYTSDAQQTTLAVALGSVTPGSTGQTIEVASITGWPTSYPFTILIDWGQTDQEVATVTQAATGTGPFTFANCIRGDDGSLSPSHTTSATVTHGTSARDFAQPAQHVNSFPQGMAPAGITGATVATRYVGGVTGAHPATGTFQAGDWVADTNGGYWTCTAGGTPGTWVQTSGTGGGGAVSSVFGRTGAVVATSGDYTVSQVTGAAPLASPALTGSPTAPTQTTGDSSTKVATDAFVTTAVAAETTRAQTAEALALPKAGGTMTGWLAPAVVALTFATTVAVNAALGNAFNLTLTASTATLGAPSNPVDGQVIRVRVTQGTGGSFTLAYNAIYDFGAAGAPTLSTAAAKVDILAFEYVASISKWCYLGSGLGY